MYDVKDQPLNPSYEPEDELVEEAMETAREEYLQRDKFSPYNPAVFIDVLMDSVFDNRKKLKELLSKKDKMSMEEMGKFIMDCAFEGATRNVDYELDKLHDEDILNGNY